MCKQLKPHVSTKEKRRIQDEPNSTQQSAPPSFPLPFPLAEHRTLQEESQYHVRSATSEKKTHSKHSQRLKKVF
jgi:hypothetical protein